MSGLEIFTLALRQLLALVTVPLMTMIAFGRIWPVDAPGFAVLGMIVIVLGWIALWIVGVVRIVRGLIARSV